jgi:hypothetical protein
MYHDCHEEEELYRKHRHFQKELLHLEEEDAKLLLLRPLVSRLIYSVEALHLLAFLHHPETDDSAALELPVASRLEQGR